MAKHVVDTGVIAELVVIRGANHPDALPVQEPRVRAEVAERYAPGRGFAEVTDAWRPYRTWGAVHLRVLRTTERLTPTAARGTPVPA
ncbi:DNA glycosylase family protein [Pseudonocardia adelaidensis]|uniref:Uncharacterized protein n=1 Tax=Pseudonocardia adelaidensis TaxID=648754 RepID=A0ABP9NUM5_9PSEU